MNLFRSQSGTSFRTPRRFARKTCGRQAALECGASAPLFSTPDLASAPPKGVRQDSSNWANEPVPQPKRNFVPHSTALRAQVMRPPGRFGVRRVSAAFFNSRFGIGATEGRETRFFQLGE